MIKKMRYIFNSIEISLGELLYYGFFGALFAAKGVGLETSQWPFKVCVVIAAVCFLGKLCVTKHTVKQWLIMGLFVLLGVLIYFNSGELAALTAVLVIIGMKDVPLRRLFRVCLLIWSCTFALSMILGIFHIRDGVVVVHQKLGLGPIIRWSMGYTHPNVLHVSYFVLASLILYVCEFHGKALWKACGALFAGNVLVFLFSISYTGVLIVTGYLVLILYLDARKRLTPAENGLFQCVLPFCVLFPLVGPFITSGKVFDFFNKLLSTRFNLVKMYFTEFTPTLFGTAARFETNAHLTLDSSFAYLLMYYGIVAFGLFLLGYFLIIRYFVRNKMNKELAMMLAIVTAAITEQFLFNLSFKNLSFFFLGWYLFEVILQVKEKDSVLEREFGLISNWNIVLKLPDLENGVGLCSKCWKKKFRRNMILMAAAALLSAGVCAVTTELPDSVYVNRGLTEYRNVEEEVFLDSAQVSEGINSLIIGYAGPETGMYCFSGNIITLEYIRKIVAAAALGAFLIWVGTTADSAVSVWKARRRQQKVHHQ